MDSVAGEGYRPEAGFEEDSREPLFDLSFTQSDSTELWLIQWPHNQPPDFHGKELPLNLLTDGCMATFEGTSGKVYDVVSCAAQEPDATVFQSSASGTKIVGNISRRVSLVHYPDPKELEKREADKKSRQSYQMSAGPSYHSATPSRSTMLRNSNSSRGDAALTHSGRHKSSLSEVGEQSSVKKRRHNHGRTASTDRSTLDSGRAQSGYTVSG